MLCVVEHINTFFLLQSRILLYGCIIIVYAYPSQFRDNKIWFPVWDYSKQNYYKCLHTGFCEIGLMFQLGKYLEQDFWVLL